MGNVTDENPVSKALEDVITNAIVRALVDPRVREALRADDCAVDRTSMTRKQLSKALGIGLATVHRLVHEGMPSSGEKRLRRFDVDKCRTWIAERPIGPARVVDDEVSGLAKRAGLAIVKGGAR
jgi:hypothetical protein